MSPITKNPRYGASFPYISETIPANNGPAAHPIPNVASYAPINPPENFFCALTTRYYSDIYAAASNSFYGADGGKIPGSTIIYGNLGYRLFNKVKINVAIDNILNEKHYGAAPYGESVWIQPRTPQSLRKIYGGITYNF